MSMDVRPHAYDPATQPELFEGVLSRRVIAFLIDFLVISIPVVLAAMFIFAFGIVTLGLGFMLYWLLSPAAVIWALVYFGLTLGGERSATIGMRVMDLEMRTWYGGRPISCSARCTPSASGSRCRSSRRSSCWCRSSTSAGGCCTTSFSAPW